MYRIGGLFGFERYSERVGKASLMFGNGGGCGLGGDPLQRERLKDHLGQ